jgi:large subunit ribosomal protein L23
VLNARGKVKRLGRFVGKRSDWKKAFVTLKEGEKLELYESV